MKATVNQEGCIGCGLCAETCPCVFVMDDSSVATVICDEIPTDVLTSALEVSDSCPASVISIS
ncbi:MAG: ferredoxin [Oscillospiraceae bacterium]